MELTFRPWLTRGAHLTSTDENGQFCLVEAVGFNVDRTVNDHHSSVDTVLAAMARSLNDRMCSHDGLNRGHVGYPGDKANICEDCQAKLWAVGERIALTAVDAEHLTEAELAAVHVQLAIIAAETVLRAIDKPSILHTIAEAAIDCAKNCMNHNSDDNRRNARTAADEVDSFPFADLAQSWAADAAAKVARTAARYTSAVTAFEPETHLEIVSGHAVEVVSYATFATAGDPLASMRLARRVLNAFGKFTSQKATPGPSPEDIAQGQELMRYNGVAVVADCGCSCECPCPNPINPSTNAAGPGELPKCAPCVEGRHTAQVAHLAEVMDVPVAAIMTLSEREAAAAKERACLAAPSWAECEEAYNARAAVADAALAEAAGDDQDMNDFHESQLGDVADEAIGDLSQAVLALEAIAAEHRPVAAWTRRRESGVDVDIQYQTECCISCRDVNGNPVPSPCRTMAILDKYQDA